jgi:hypothetical protein
MILRPYQLELVNGALALWRTGRQRPPLTPNARCLVKLP